jgi:hypothetical protein
MEEDEVSDGNNEIETIEVPDNEGIIIKNFVNMVNDAADGNDLLKLIDILPKNDLEEGHSCVMNRIIKLFCKDKKYNTENFMVMKIMKDKTEKSTPRTFNSLTQLMKDTVRSFIKQSSPSEGVGKLIKKDLLTCKKSFSETAVDSETGGFHSNRICCVEHMLCDPLVTALLTKIVSEQLNDKNTRPARLENRKVGEDISTVMYTKIYNTCKEWQKGYINQYKDGLKWTECSIGNPHKAKFKDSMQIKDVVTQVFGEVDWLMEAHGSSGTNHEGDA